MRGCKICGEENCKKHSFLIGKSVQIKEFSGSTPPEIFIGKWNYPNVYTGILSPQEHGNTEIMSSHELWQKNKLQIPTIMNFRNQLIYGRTQSNVKKPLQQSKFLSTLQEVAMTSASVSAEFKLKKPIEAQKERDIKVPLISHAAQIESARLQENTKISEKVDYLVNDTDAKSVHSMLELEKAKTPTSSIVKLLSAGLLGLRKNRKLVPTRWSITAVDDSISKDKLKRIRYNKEISDIELFQADYLGNNYHFLLIPDKWSFEVIEISMKDFGIWQDYESFFPRKNYADDVTGAYYANRLAVSEYLERVGRQASCIVFREIRPEYYAPLGVGILRETSREAFRKQPIKFQNIREALDAIQKNLRISINYFKEKSIILKNHGKQRKLTQFI